jgi:hypothetical protein
MGVESIEDFQEPPLRVGCNILVDVGDPQYYIWGHLLPCLHFPEFIFGLDDCGADLTTIVAKEGISIPNLFGLELHQDFFGPVSHATAPVIYREMEELNSDVFFSCLFMFAAPLNFTSRLSNDIHLA